jgi:hypothetical protein
VAKGIEMIAEAAQDILDKIRTVTALTDATGIALGGKGTDPGQQKLPLPSCWLMYGKDDPDELPFENGRGPGIVPAQQVITITMVAMIYIQYTTQADMLAVQYPLLRSVIAAVHGQAAVNRNRWRYVGQKLAFVYPDRIAYEQHYTLTVVM